MSPQQREQRLNDPAERAPMPMPKRLCAVAALLLAPLLSHASAGCVRPGDSVFADSFESSQGSVRYVAQPGSDAADGSLNTPWATIQHAVNLLNPGDTLCVRAGVYNETVGITRSGMQAAPIVVRAEPGEAAVVDGTGLGVPGHQWGLITLSDASYVTISGFELRNYKRNTSADVPIGLYVTGAGSGLRVIGNHIHDIANSASGCAANAFGLKVDGTRAPQSIDGIVIAGNEIDHLVLGCSESFSLDGNVQNFTISGNSVHDTNNIGIGAIGFEGVAPDPAYDQARDGTIVGNTVYNITSFGNPAYGNQYAADGIYIDGGTRITIERNRIHHVDLGIELASEHATRTTSHVLARNNLVYFGNSSGISLGGYDAGVGGTDQCTVINNTLFENDSKNTGSGELQIQYHATANTIENNILQAGASGVLLYAYTGDTAAPAMLDHNVYFSSASAGALSWTWKGNDYPTLDAFRAASAQDAQSNYATPLFLDALAPDLRVAPASPAVGGGVNAGASVVGASDFAGSPRVIGTIDVGAYEQ